METATIVLTMLSAIIVIYVLYVILRTIWRVLMMITAPVRWVLREITWLLGRHTKRRRAYIPQDIKARVFARHGADCVNCGAGQDIQLDHIIPLARGGTDNESNLAPVCRTCNGRKGAC